MLLMKPERTRDYTSFLFDSTRWNDFELRPNDILVCTSYKSGTTWTQMICAMLVHQNPDLPKPMLVMSPWLDIRLANMSDINQELGSQQHQRIIKTHTPLDGLPWHDDVHYVYCGREPRDVFMSSISHRNNIKPERFMEIMLEQGNTPPAEPPEELPDDINELFKIWMSNSTFEWERDGAPFWSHFQHAYTYWKHRDLPNIHFLHYADLKADLEGEMKKLALQLGIEVPDEKWPELVSAATFSSMKEKADMTAPDTNHGIWQSDSQFFNKDTNEQWRGAQSDENVSMYEQVSRQRYDHDMLIWLGQGSLISQRPEDTQ
jgi:aryl sulfotransferase